MPAYEALFIFKPDLKEEEQKTLIESLEKLLKDNKANIETSQVYGKRQFAYEINKLKEGLYYLIQFTSGGAVCAILKHACNINENVIRLLVTKRDIKH